MRYFQAAATACSMRRAADQLNVSPSALSRQISALEEKLGAPLFERMPRGVKLTSAGEILLFHAEQSFKELDRAQKAIAELKGLRRGQINIAIVESAARGLLPPVLAALWARHADVKVSVQVAGTYEVLRRVERGEADIGIAFNVLRETDLMVVDVARLRIGAIMSRNHELAGRKSLKVQDLVGRPVFLADSSLMLRDALADAERSWALDVRLVTNSITLMSALAATTNGIALKTKVGVSEEIERGELNFVPVDDRRLPVQHLAVVVRRNLAFPALVNTIAKECTTALSRIRED
ncbi:LysR family transcriptional regulator [Devosia sp. 1566]|uniref:LysR family transcriptional regulator n=1 Tax=Devosia sp. 1566 TaxID=2499144 RepID=UPI0024A72A3F|nr:LysR family transcriptional regulator [Devosia sp. 1566]